MSSLRPLGSRWGRAGINGPKCAVCDHQTKHETESSPATIPNCALRPFRHLNPAASSVGPAPRPMDSIAGLFRHQPIRFYTEISQGGKLQIPADTAHHFVPAECGTCPISRVTCFVGVFRRKGTAAAKPCGKCRGADAPLLHIKPTIQAGRPTWAPWRANVRAARIAMIAAICAGPSLPSVKPNRAPRCRRREFSREWARCLRMHQLADHSSAVVATHAGPAASVRRRTADHRSNFERSDWFETQRSADPFTHRFEKVPHETKVDNRPSNAPLPAKYPRLRVPPPKKSPMPCPSLDTAPIRQPGASSRRGNHFPGGGAGNKIGPQHRKTGLEHHHPSRAFLASGFPRRLFVEILDINYWRSGRIFGIAKRARPS